MARGIILHDNGTRLYGISDALPAALAKEVASDRKQLHLVTGRNGLSRVKFQTGGRLLIDIYPVLSVM